MSQMRRVIQHRNKLSDSDSDAVENVLRAYSERQISDDEAVRRLKAYVPNEAGMDMNSLLPILLSLLSGRQGSGDLGDMIGTFMGGQPDRPQPTQGSGGLEDLIGALLGGGQQAPAYSPREGDLQDLIGMLLNPEQQAPPERPSQPQGGGLMDLFNELLGGGQDNPPDRPSGNAPNTGGHNLRKRR